MALRPQLRLGKKGQIRDIPPSLCILLSAKPLLCQMQFYSYLETLSVRRRRAVLFRRGRLPGSFASPTCTVRYPRFLSFEETFPHVSFSKPDSQASICRRQHCGFLMTAPAVFPGNLDRHSTSSRAHLARKFSCQKISMIVDLVTSEVKILRSQTSNSNLHITPQGGLRILLVCSIIPGVQRPNSSLSRPIFFPSRTKI